MRIAIVGAGSIGGFVAGSLAAVGVDTTVIARERQRDELARGIRLTAIEQPPITVAPERFAFATDASAAVGCAAVLVCVKSGQTADTGRELARVLPRDALIISLQNGIHNADDLRAACAPRPVAAGIVGFNVVSKGGGEIARPGATGRAAPPNGGAEFHFHRTTTGPIALELVAGCEDRVRAVGAALARAGFALELAAPVKMRGKQWAKLLMNLNNAISALSGAPTYELIFTAGYRSVLRAVIGEATLVLRAARIRPARLGAIPATWFPAMLALPTPVLKVVARAQIRIDPEARSSMWEDLERRRTTEVEQLNGEIVRLAARSGVAAPINARLCELVHAAERAGQGSPKLAADALWRALR